MRKLLLLFGFGLVLVNGAYGQKPTPEQVRGFIAESIKELKVAPEQVASVEDRRVAVGSDSIRIRIYRPSSGKNLPIIYQIHGAGFVAGDLETHDNICRSLSRRANAIVVAVDYRRPPEHPYPAAVNDSYAVLQWIQANAAALGSNGKIILIGDSAGGNLVPAVALKNRDQQKPVPITGMILINPALDLRKSSSSGKTYPLFLNWYVPDSLSRLEPLASPLLSSSLKGLPPALVVVGEKDDIKDEGVAFHAGLQKAGVASTLFEQKGSDHFGPLWCATHPEVEPSLKAALAAIKKWTE
jgi:acetyl esterase